MTSAVSVNADVSWSFGHSSYTLVGPVETFQVGATPGLYPVYRYYIRLKPGQYNFSNRWTLHSQFDPPNFDFSTWSDSFTITADAGWFFKLEQVYALAEMSSSSVHDESYYSEAAKPDKAYLSMFATPAASLFNNYHGKCVNNQDLIGWEWGDATGGVFMNQHSITINGSGWTWADAYLCGAVKEGSLPAALSATSSFYGMAQFSLSNSVTAGAIVSSLAYSRRTNRIANITWSPERNTGAGKDEATPLLPQVAGTVDTAACGSQATGMWTNAISGNWFSVGTPAHKFLFRALNGSSFTSISNFPSGIQVTVEAGGSILGTYTNGQRLDFSSWPGGGIPSFTVSQATASLPDEIPLALTFNRKSANFEVFGVSPPQVILALHDLDSADSVSLESTNTLAPHRNVKLEAVILGGCPAKLQWSFADTNIVGATNATLSLTNLASRQSGRYKVTVQNEQGRTEEAMTLVIPSAPITPMNALSAGHLANSTTVTVLFDREVDPATGVQASNYQVEGARVVAAKTAKSGRLVVLTVEGTLAQTFEVKVSGVKDILGNNVADSSVIVGSTLPQRTLSIGVTNDPVTPGEGLGVGSGEFFVTAGGSDIWDTSDHFQFTYEAIAGDFDFRARVESIESVDRWSKAALMARADLSPGSRQLSVGVTPVGATRDGLFEGFGQNNYYVEARGLTGGVTESWSIANTDVNAPPFPNAWLRLKRSGDLFSGYRSSDGLAWTQISEKRQALPLTLFIGLATTSHNNTAGFVAEAIFHDFSRTDFLPPKILAQPKATTTVPFGEPVHLDVTAVGTGPFHYQWRLNGTKIPGATNAFYEIPHADRKDAGNYRVVVDGSQGSINSLPAAVIVIEAIKLQAQLNAAGTALKIGITGTSGQTLRVERTTDFIQWNLETIIVNATGVAEVETSLPDAMRQFYRVRLDDN